MTIEPDGNSNEEEETFGAPCVRGHLPIHPVKGHRSAAAMDSARTVQGRLPAALQRQIRRESARWVEEVRRDILRELREPQGGWPGTVREARERLWLYVLRNSEALPSSTEPTDAVRYFYRTARAGWRAAQECDVRERLPNEDS